MEHRCTERYNSDLSVLIFQHKVPIAIGRINNGSRIGAFVETECLGVECGNKISLEVALNRNSIQKVAGMEIQALVIHKKNNGFGVELDIDTKEQSDVFLALLRGNGKSIQDSAVFSLTENKQQNTA